MTIRWHQTYLLSMSEVSEVEPNYTDLRDLLSSLERGDIEVKITRSGSVKEEKEKRS